MGSIGDCIRNWLQASRNRDCSLSGLCWHRGLAFVATVLALLFVLCAHRFGWSPLMLVCSWLVCSATFWPVFLAGSATLARGWPGIAGTAAGLVVLEAALVWTGASFSLYIEQGRPLVWRELASRFHQGIVWPILKDAVLTAEFVLFSAAAFAAPPVLALVLARIPRRVCQLATLGLLAAVLGIGTLLAALRCETAGGAGTMKLETAAAPWSPLQDEHRGFEQTFDDKAAAAVRARVCEPFWTPGPAPVLPDLAGKYEGRSIVLVIQESLRASDVAGIGEGAFGHRTCAPALSRMAREGVVFTHYLAAGNTTHSALWTILTGLPVPGGGSAAVVRAPRAARLGRLPDFENRGYACEWLCPTRAGMDNWDRLLDAAGARYWLEKDEIAALPRDLWTAWGMPDEQLYAIAFRRYAAAIARGRPVFLGVLTVSNHHPFRLPDEVDGERLPRDHYGGTRYADHCLGRFVESLRGLPADQQPIVFVTGDHPHLQDLWTSGRTESLEAARVPGLLMLPDRAAAGRRYDGPFCHEDLLDMLFLLIEPEARSGQGKFIGWRRAVASALGGSLLATENALARCSPRGMETHAIVNRWDLHSPAPPGAAERFQEALQRLAAEESAMWPRRR